MKQKRFTVEQIAADLKQAEAGVSRAELLRRVGVSEQTFYRWKKQNVGLELDQIGADFRWEFTLMLDYMDQQISLMFRIATI